MKFERLTNEVYGAKKAGYVIDTEEPRITDADLYVRLANERGSRFVETKLDILYDNDGDLYKGEDGNLYAVEYVSADGDYKPFCWQRLKKVMYMVKPEYADRVFGSETPEPITRYEVDRLAEEWEMSPGDLLEQFEEV